MTKDNEPKKVLLTEATFEQLKLFATVTLGLDLPENVTENTLRKRIGDVGYAKDHIMVVDVVQMKVPVTAKFVDDAKVKIIITEQDEPGGSEPVFVSVNGSAMLIPRGKVVEVPKPYYEVLCNANKLVYTALPEGGLGPAREVPMYPFRAVA